jgi:glucose-6-phosphate isomerase
MESIAQQRWQRFKKYYREYPDIGLSLDISRMAFDEAALEALRPKFESAFEEMRQLEAGSIANKDENRMVGHYWLRAPHLAPTKEIREAITTTRQHIESFVKRVHSGEVRGQNGLFRHILLIGIGGSALGPQFVSDALAESKSTPMSISFLDNTDPDGMDRVFDSIPDLGTTVCLVVSKSGGTKETRNGMVEAMHRYQSLGLRFADHAVAITGAGSELDNLAVKQQWIARFPMWDWVGGRTSETSAVGVLPAMLQHIDVELLISSSANCDSITRIADFDTNPAAILASAWHLAGSGKGLRDMVVLPYSDRLVLFSRYLQQLVMESLGKSHDRNGNRVYQGLAVYGNKGSTDQHAYVQQLRDGIDNFFVTFIEVRGIIRTETTFVETKLQSADFLAGLLHGTREALTESGRQSITITIDRVSAKSVGVLIALFERAVGLYASLINVNAYHQPGVEAGKQAAAGYLATHLDVMQWFDSNPSAEATVEAVAAGIGRSDLVESVMRICRNLEQRRTIRQVDIGKVGPNTRFKSAL